MAQIIETVNHAAGIPTDYAAPVGKKIYGFTNISATDIQVTCDGVVTEMLSNTGQRSYMLPVPLEFKASTVIRFTGSAVHTIGIIRDE